MWRIKERNPNIERISLNEFKRCVFYEIGTDTNTIRKTRENLVVLCWIKTFKKGKWIEIQSGDWEE